MSVTAVSYLGYAFMLSEIMLAIRRRAGRTAARSADRGSLLLLWVVIVVSITFAYSFAYSPTGRMSDAVANPVRSVGLVIFVAGLALRWYAIIYLGRFFTVNVAIAFDHRIIDSGPYLHLRHPSYSGALLAFLGLGLCMANWISLACALIPTSLAFLWRIRVEEAALIVGLGDKYREYMRHTRRLIPGIY